MASAVQIRYLLKSKQSNNLLYLYLVAIKICEGDSIILSIINNAYPEGTLYHWTVSPGSSQVTTTKPNFIIPVSTTANTGIYNVFAEKEGCFSKVSDDVVITVIKQPNQPSSPELLNCAKERQLN